MFNLAKDMQGRFCFVMAPPASGAIDCSHLKRCSLKWQCSSVDSPVTCLAWNLLSFKNPSVLSAEGPAKKPFALFWPGTDCQQFWSSCTPGPWLRHWNSPRNTAGIFSSLNGGREPLSAAWSASALHSARHPHQMFFHFGCRQYHRVSVTIPDQPTANPAIFMCFNWSLTVEDSVKATFTVSQFNTLISTCPNDVHFGLKYWIYRRLCLMPWPHTPAPVRHFIAFIRRSRMVRVLTGGITKLLIISIQSHKLLPLLSFVLSSLLSFLFFFTAGRFACWTAVALPL